jgi:hypothetical protein
MEWGIARERAMPHYPMLTSTLREPQSNITHMGAAARSLLAPGQCGQVLAAFSNVVYLLTTSNELVWVASGSAPLHRRCLKVSAPLPRLAAGAPFSVQDHCLKLDRRLVLDSAAATLWQAPRVNRNQAVEIGAIPGRVRALAAGLDFSQAPGLARFIPNLLRCGPDCVAATDDPVLTHAKPLVLDMADACRSQDRQRIVLGAEALIGFGGGLTPSGDDFLGGLLFGIRTLLAVYPGLNPFDMAIIGEPYRSRTNPISFTLLDDLAKGHAIEPLHRIVNGILEGEFPANVHLAIVQLTQVGHSTGWDMLAGLFTGLLLTDASDHRHGSLETVQSVQT